MLRKAMLSRNASSPFCMGRRLSEPVAGPPVELVGGACGSGTRVLGRGCGDYKHADED